MNILKTTVRSALVLSLAWAFSSPFAQPVAAEVKGSVPAVIQAGFDLWSKGGGVDVVLAEWQKGGLMEGESKAAAQADYFRRVNRAAGSYRGYELLQAKAIGRRSQVIYLSINFERGAVFARFLLYRADESWVVQNMDFSSRPEAVMPWLAYEGEKNPEY
ncbi:MAG: hypothetical protein ABSF95_22055 [Verrucomicrobiota bacterium]